MPQLQGSLVCLRPIEPDDIDFFATLEYDAESTRLGAGYVPVPWSRHRLTAWLQEQSAKAHEGDVYRLVMETLRDDQAVGLIQTHSLDRRVGVFSYGVEVIEQRRRHGYASDAIRTLLRYFFEELGYQKCNASVYSFNDASLALHNALGFVHEGTERRTKFTGGRYHDNVLLGMTCEEFAAAGGL
jgi:RimJ/RimL family protein N-acetyltransferase